MFGVSTPYGAVPCPEGKMSRKYLLPECKSSVHRVLFHACTCDTQTQQAAMSKEFYDTEKIPSLYHIQALQSRTVLQGGRQEGCWA